VKIYRDAELKDEVTEADRISFGEVEVGLKKEITIYILNDTDGELENIELDIPENHGVTIIDKPETINKHGSTPVTLRWKPSLDLREALETNMIITAKEIYR